ncbi:hypothetical protein CF65_01941 [Aggregatibacter actinomycetemcomitans HK1651]|nr:hypothetical protein CF65_01941 [Aggregatibacter actinomycetemcomitans HK1651]
MKIKSAVIFHRTFLFGYENKILRSPFQIRLIQYSFHVFYVYIYPVNNWSE